MTHSLYASSLDAEIEWHVDAFEDRLESDPEARWNDFLPDRAHCKFLRVAAELVRVDLEFSWSQGRHRAITDYSVILPELFEDETLRAELAFEEYRQRQSHGQNVNVQEFARKYHVSSAGWSTVVHAKDRTATTKPFSDLAAYVPTAGQRWRDFEILREIGRGAQSRVMLARQTSLSGRQVVLKFASKNDLEAEKIARLQHPHIVAVFSVYEDQHFHVFCMPYLGETTLANQTLPLDESRALKIVQQLASAMEHAHERGILHNDLKPANVLLVDGQPMLLDFNLAADVTGQMDTSQIGGTLPYMAPESLQAMRDQQPLLSPSSDLFSLGVLLYRLLVGRLPFDDGVNLAELLERRKSPQLSPLGQRTPGTAAIVRKCLCYDPAQRYRSARELRTDIESHRAHRALAFASNSSRSELLAKWCRRHPRLTSITSVVAMTFILSVTTTCAWLVRERHVDRLEAGAHFAQFQQQAKQLSPQLTGNELPAVDLDVALVQAERLLGRYVDEDDHWNQSDDYSNLSAAAQQQVRRQIAELSFMAAAGHSRFAARDAERIKPAMRWNTVSQRAYGQPRRSTLQQLAILQRLAEDPQASSTFEQSQTLALADSIDMHFVGSLERYQGNAELALVHLQAACDAAPDDFLNWFDRALAHVDLRQWQAAEHCLTTSLALFPESEMAVYARALCRQELGQYAEAIEDYSRALDALSKNGTNGHVTEENMPAPLDPACCLLNRAIAFKAAGKLELALDDLNQAIAMGYNSTRPLLIRSRVQRDLGNFGGANEDYQQALAATPRDELGWVARGVARMTREPKQAEQDFLQGLNLNPRSHSARRNLAYVLSEQLDKTDEAIRWLDELIEDYPNDSDSIGGRGVLLARSEQYELAIADARRIASLDHASPRAILQAACVYAMASVNKPQWKTTAADLVGLALREDPSLAAIARNDRDLQEIHEFEAFVELCRAGKRLADIPEASRVIQHGDQP